MKKILTLALCAVLLLGASVVLAQHGFHHKTGGPEKGRARHAGHAEFIARALDLTDEQKAAAKKIHEETFAKAEPLMEQHREQMEEVHALLDGANPDATEIGRKVIAAHATRQQLKTLHEDAMTRFSALLNADQLEKLKEIQERHGEHGPMGFGHGHGRGPGRGF